MVNGQLAMGRASSVPEDVGGGEGIWPMGRSAEAGGQYRDRVASDFGMGSRSVAGLDWLELYFDLGSQRFGDPL